MTCHNKSSQQQEERCWFRLGVAESSLLLFFFPNPTEKKKWEFSGREVRPSGPSQNPAVCRCLLQSSSCVFYQASHHHKCFMHNKWKQCCCPQPNLMVRELYLIPFELCTTSNAAVPKVCKSFPITLQSFRLLVVQCSQNHTEWGGMAAKITPESIPFCLHSHWTKAPAQLPRGGIEIPSSSLPYTAVLPCKRNVPEVLACAAHQAGFIAQQILNLKLQNA